jgi:hypothetical protein
MEKYEKKFKEQKLKEATKLNTRQEAQFDEIISSLILTLNDPTSIKRMSQYTLNLITDSVQATIDEISENKGDVEDMSSAAEAYLKQLGKMLQKVSFIF